MEISRAILTQSGRPNRTYAIGQNTVTRANASYTYSFGRNTHHSPPCPRDEFLNLRCIYLRKNQNFNITSCCKRRVLLFVFANDAHAAPQRRRQRHSAAIYRTSHRPLRNAACRRIVYCPCLGIRLGVYNADGARLFRSDSRTTRFLQPINIPFTRDP